MPAIRKPVDTSCLGSVVSGGAPIRAFNVVGFHPFFHGFIAQPEPTALQTLAPISGPEIGSMECANRLQRLTVLEPSLYTGSAGHVSSSARQVRTPPLPADPRWAPLIASKNVADDMRRGYAGMGITTSLTKGAIVHR
jgi:hypothetical protein